MAGDGGYGMRLKRNRKVDKPAAADDLAAALWAWPGQNRPALTHSVLVVKDGRRYWGTNDLTLTPREVKAHSSHRPTDRRNLPSLETRGRLGRDVRVKNNRRSGRICTWACMRCSYLNRRPLLHPTRLSTPSVSRYLSARSHKILRRYRSLPRLRNLRGDLKN